MLMRDILLGANAPPRQSGHHRLPQLQRRRQRQPELERGHAPSPRDGQQLPEPEPQPRRGQARDRRGQRPLPDGLQPLGSDPDLRRPHHGPRPARLRHRLHHLHRAGRPSRPARLRLRQAVPGDPRSHPPRLRPRGLHPLPESTPSGRRPRWSHEAAIWTNEAKFVANAYGLRNRMSILAETPGARVVRAPHLRPLRPHRRGPGVRDRARPGDAGDLPARRPRRRRGRQSQAESGRLRNFVAGKYGSYGKVDILVYKERNASTLVPGTSVRARIAPHMLRAPELVRGVEFLCKAVGVAEARSARAAI